FNIYNKVWAYASVGELRSIVFTVSLTVLSARVVQFFLTDYTIYRRGLVVTWLFYIVLMVGSRFLWRVVRDEYIVKNKNKVRTLIVGAGDAGALIVRQLSSASNGSDLQPVGLVDDSQDKQKIFIYNISVVDKIRDIHEIVEKEEIENIVIAIPTLKISELKTIIDICSTTDVRVQKIPKIEDIMTGKVSVSSLRNVEVEDLLGREPVQLDTEKIESTIQNETIMVTGAGGSI